MESDMKKLGITLIPMESQKLNEILREYPEITKFIDSQKQEFEGGYGLRYFLDTGRLLIKEKVSSEYRKKVEEEYLDTPYFAEEYKEFMKTEAAKELLAELLKLLRAQKSKKVDVKKIVQEAIEEFDIIDFLFIKNVIFERIFTGNVQYIEAKMRAGENWKS